MIADATVHTTGINILGVLAILIPVISCLIGLAVFIDQRNQRRETKREQFVERIQAETKDEITTAVNHLSEVLLERLETKESVNQIRVDLAAVKIQLADIRQRQNGPHTG